MTKAIDHHQFMELKDLLEDDFHSLVSGFLVDSQQRLDEIKAAYQAENNTAGLDAVHSLKGASANLGAVHLSHLCNNLQEECHKKFISRSSALIEGIEEELQRVHQEVKDYLND